MNTPQLPLLIRFAAFELDLRASELRKDGRSTGLADQSVTILAMLLNRPGELVLREDIRTKLWPNDTVVEFDHSINTAIGRLRQALGDSAEKPRYIETLPRRGYRFLAEVEPSERRAAKKPAGLPSRLEGRVFKLVAEEVTACVVAPVDWKAFEEWERLTRLKDDVGVAMMITEKRLLLLEAGGSVRLLAMEGTPKLCEVRVLEGEHYGKTALVQRKALRAEAGREKIENRTCSGG